MEQEPAFVALGVALGVGLLIGFEREQAASDDAKPGDTSMGGVRTYPLVSLAGALATMLSREVGPWFVALAFAAVAGLVGISYADDVRQGRDRGLTSEAAMLLAFLLGALAPSEGLMASTKEKVVVLFSVAVVVTLILSLKPALHGLAKKTTKVDVYATLKFLLVAVVLLPLLPDRTFGPLDVLNPFKIGLLIVLIAGVGFAGYVAVRALGPGRGLGVTGLVGGLVSSTAVTLASAGHARREPRLAPSCALAIVLANTIMAPRVLVVVAAVQPSLVPVLAIPVGGLVLVGVVASWIFWRRAQGARGEAGTLEIKNPFELSSAIKMGLLITVVLFVSKAASVNFGQSRAVRSSSICFWRAPASSFSFFRCACSSSSFFFLASSFFRISSASLRFRSSAVAAFSRFCRMLSMRASSLPRPAVISSAATWRMSAGSLLSRASW